MNMIHNNKLDLDKNPDSSQYSENLKKLYAKLASVSGYLIAMRSDALNVSKHNDDDLKALLKYVKSIKRNLEIYFIIILLLVLLIFQKFIWTNSIGLSGTRVVEKHHLSIFDSDLN